MEDKIFSVTRSEFNSLSLEVFRFQYQNNTIYQQWVNSLGIDPNTVVSLEKIPFLPISFFKSLPVKTTSFEPEVVFESSGTTGMAQSRHHVKSKRIYRQSFLRAFNLVYGDVSKYCILGLLPSYLERKNSSLVMMVEELIRESGQKESGFYLYDHEKLFELLGQLNASGKPAILIGVTFALLDFAERYTMQLDNVIVIETGGMKGRREEMTREELHALLKARLGVNSIHSEYGMTELLSQAYSRGDGIFQSPPWMKIMIREEDDPLELRSSDKGKSVSGAINIIDLANLYSCAFIASDDLGRLSPDGSFTVEGRLDSSDLRGCSLLTLT